MKYLLTFLILATTPIDNNPKVTGIVEFENEAMPGCNVVLVGSSISVLTDIDGKFELSIPLDNSKYSIKFVAFEGAGLFASTVITGIPLADSTINLGRIPIYLNKFIEPEEFNALTPSEQEEFAASYSPHGPRKLLGYYHKNKIDTSQLSTLFEVYQLEPTDWQYSQTTNILAIPYLNLMN